MEAILYNFGTFWEFNEKRPNNQYSGFYYHKPGNKDGGIEIQYTNGNHAKTGYHPCSTAEEALSHVKN